MAVDNGRLPGDLELLRPWFPIIRRLRQIGGEAGGMAAVTIRVVVDQGGDPVPPWVSMGSVRLEPKMDADQAIAHLLECLLHP